MGYSLKVQGSVSGRMLAVAMLKAHAVTSGGLAEKQAVGGGMFVRYLGKNSVRNKEWERQSKLSPEAVLARASLSGEWLKRAGQLLENATDVEQRRDLLGQIIAPHLETVATSFGAQILQKVKKPKLVKVSDIADLLEHQLPGIELEMVEIPAKSFEMIRQWGDVREREIRLSAFRIGEYKITNDQYGIYMGQTGHSEPHYWEDPTCGKGHPKNPVGVFEGDAKTFCKWMNRRLPTVAEWACVAGTTEDLIKIEGPMKPYFMYSDGAKPVDTHLEKEYLNPFGVKDLSGKVEEWWLDWRKVAEDRTSKILKHQVYRGAELPYQAFQRDRHLLDMPYCPGGEEHIVGFHVAEDI